MLKPVFRSFAVVLVLGIVAGVAALPKIREFRHAPQPTPTPRPEVTVTVVEGKRREEIAMLMEKKEVCSAEAFLAASEGKEGFLFPDTYRFFKHEEADTVVRTLLRTFSEKTKTLNPSANAVILASIVEREARNDEERAAIAGVYANRIRVGMKLDADPTVQYARDDSLVAAAVSVSDVSFWKPITAQDYKSVASPYNTYLHAGLPPTPIANPGLQSLQAAVHPAEHSYFYFFHRDNQIILSQTLSEHLRKLAGS